MKSFFLVSLFLFFKPAAYAQSNADSLPRYTAIKWASQSLLWPGHFIEMGVEKRVGKYAGILHAGVSVPTRYNITDTINNPSGSLSGTYSGFTVRLEGRRYSKPKPRFKNANFFVGIDVFYTQYQAGGYGTYTDRQRTIEPYLDKYLLNKSMVGLTAVKLGVQQRWGNHFLIEYFWGIGIKIKNVRQEGMFDESHKSASIHNYGGPVLGTEVTLAAPLNFCIGYYF